MGLVHLFMNFKEETRLRSLLKGVFWLANTLIVMLWIYVFIVRYMHSGQECSGDFIVSKKEAKYLMYVEGMFIKFCSLLIFFIVLLYVMGSILNKCQQWTGGTVSAIEFEI